MDMAQAKAVLEDTSQQQYENLLEVANFYLNVGNYDLAQECYNRAGAVAPNESKPYLGLGAVALARGMLDEAEMAHEMAAWIDQDSSEAYCGLAMVHQRRGDLKAAYRMYSKSLKFDPANLTAILGLYCVSTEVGAFAKVIHYLQLYLQAHPHDTQVMFCLAVLFVRQQQFDKAEEILLNMLVSEPKDKRAANLLEELSHRRDEANRNAPVTPPAS